MDHFKIEMTDTGMFRRITTKLKKKKKIADKKL